MTPYYDEGGITIYHGDALDVLPTLDRSSFGACITDPPYVIGAVSAGSIGAKSGGWADMMNSALWFTTWYRQVDRLLRHDGAFWTFCNWRSLPVVMRSAVDAALPVTSVLVWDKEWIGPGGSQGLRPSYELVALLAQPGFALADRGIPDIRRCQASSHKEHGHPAEKPERLVRWLVEITERVPVLDPFLGSGTTAAACKILGVPFVGIEDDERYCEIAAKRLAQEVLDFGGGRGVRVRVHGPSFDVGLIPVPRLVWFWRAADPDDPVGQLSFSVANRYSDPILDVSVEFEAPRWAHGLLGMLAR